MFLGDRVYIMSSGPGRIVKELEIEPADRPALEMARVPRFQETVYYIRDLIAQYEAEAYKRINALIDAVPEVKSPCGEAVLHRAVFRTFLEKIYKRTK